MKIQLSRGRTAVISFRHYPTGTTANLEVTSHPGISSSGGQALARLQPRDHYVRTKGRKVALAKVLTLMSFPKEDRTAIWTGLIAQGMRVE